jgi:hypothetical protein
VGGLMISKEQILLGLYTYMSKIDLSKAKKKKEKKIEQFIRGIRHGSFWLFSFDQQ